MDEKAIREQFPGTREVVYFNAATASLMPEPVVRVMHEVAIGQRRGGILGWNRHMEQVERARGLAAGLIGAQPEEIAFVPSTAEGVGRVAAGLDWREGDEVVLGDIEYPANVYPWAAQRDRGVRLRFVPSEGGVLEAGRLIDAMSPRTRVLAVSFVQFTSGYRVDLEALGSACRERDVLLVVDAIQGLGVFPVDVRATGIGALAADGRKWLLGPTGAGFLYVSPQWTERIRPRVAGALSVRDSDDHLQYMRALDADGQIPLEDLLRPGAGRFETGLYNFISVAGLGEALDLGEAIGRATIRERVAALAERVVQGAAERGYEVYGPRTPAERSGIVSFSIPGSPDRIFRKLNASGFSIAVRAGRLRLSPHVYNTSDEIDAFLERLDELTGSQR